MGNNIDKNIISPDQTDDRNNKDLSGFDPSALERGAKAMKILQESPYAKQAIDLSFEQERTKQLELKRGEELIKKQNLELYNKNELEKRKTMQHQHQIFIEQEKQRVRLQKELEQHKLEEQHRLNYELLLEQTKLLQEQNEEKLYTEKQLAELKAKSATEQLKMAKDIAAIQTEAEALASIKKDKETHHLQLEKKEKELSLLHKSKMESLKLHYENITKIGSNIKDTFSDPKQLSLIVGASAGIFLSLYSARMLTKIFQTYVISKIGKPSLVRESSKTFFRSLPIINRLPPTLIDQNKNVFKDIVLSSSLSSRLEWIANSTYNTRKNKAPYRNILFTGPPGTGKTLFAKNLAKYSGLDYAIINGGDFNTSANTNGVHELHKVFDWASKNKRGSILFIDEADAILRRGRENLSSNNSSEGMRNILSAFLSRTSSESYNFMVVLASNLAYLFDPAVMDRIDDSVHFGLPELKERKRMLLLYFNRFIFPSNDKSWVKKLFSSRKNIKVEGFDQDSPIFDELASKTEGFSGRQIMKYIISIQSAVYGGISPTLNPELALSILDWKLQSTKLDENKKDLKTNIFYI